MNGKSVFDKTCGGCHRLTGKHTAPPLEGIVGRAKASIAGQEYSDALRDIGGNWTFEELNKFVANPRTAVPGTSMIFRGLPEDDQRADLILFLRNQSTDPQPLP